MRNSIEELLVGLDFLSNPNVFDVNLIEFFY